MTTRDREKAQHPDAYDAATAYLNLHALVKEYRVEKTLRACGRFDYGRERYLRLCVTYGAMLKRKEAAFDRIMDCLPTVKV